MPSVKSLVTIAVVSAAVYFGIEHYKSVKGSK
jgi:hypothetical protein